VTFSFQKLSKIKLFSKSPSLAFFLFRWGSKRTQEASKPNQRQAGQSILQINGTVGMQQRKQKNNIINRSILLTPGWIGWGSLH
jgi:hypothetical protein